MDNITPALGNEINSYAKDNKNYSKQSHIRSWVCSSWIVINVLFLSKVNTLCDCDHV